MLQLITEAQFEEKVLKADKPVLVDFFAEWCGPCTRVTPIIEDLERELSGKAYVYKMDVDECASIVKELRILSVPTFVVFKNGEVHNAAHGVQPKDYLKSMFN